MVYGYLSDGLRWAAADNLMNEACHCDEVDPDFHRPDLTKERYPFQMDGNEALGSVILLSLLDDEVSVDENGEMHPVLTLLPALPAAWPEGVVKGVAAGETVIVVTAQLADGRELETECYVTVEIAVQSISAKKQHFDLREGDEVQAEVEIRPAEASGIGLDWFSSNEDAIEVDPDGMLYAVGAGSATITARLMDGSGRSVTFTASVPSLAAPQSVVQITTRNPDPVIVNYYGRHFERDISITCTGAGATSWSEFDETSHEIRFHLIPLTAADYDITVRDLSGAGSSVSVKCRVDHSACYDTTAYPYINYENVARDPSRYHSVGSLKGYINSVSRTEDGWAFRVGVGGTAARALMVTIVDDSNTPLYIVGDVINVYGTLSGEYPGTDLPWMVADRIAGSFGEMIAP